MLPSFEDLKITTQTYVVHTNLIIPLQELFSSVNCAPFKQVYKKKMDLTQENLKDGDIIYIQYKTDTKGIKRNIKFKQMLNVVTIMVKLGEKLYNVKIAHSGKIQLTGCKGLSSVVFIIGLIIKILKKNNLLQVKDEEKMITCYSICVMSNVNIEIPFKIDRDKMHWFINMKTKHISILEKSVGYVGVNVKIKSEKESKEETTIEKIIFTKSGSYTTEPSKFSDYLKTREKNEKYKKEMYNSFLIFESGKTIMSGCASYENRKEAYEMFVDIIKNFKQEIILIEPNSSEAAAPQYPSMKPEIEDGKKAKIRRKLPKT